MAEKVIGILGGMGPEATLDCFEKIIRNTPAGKDQDHLRVIIDSNSKAPDRTAAILGKGASGCTEIPLALSQRDLSVPYFDVLLLARAAIRLAGKEPLSLR